MRRKGFWTILGIAFLLLLGLKGDSGFRSTERIQVPAFAPAGIELKSNLETKEVEPERIPMEEALHELKTPVSSAELNMPVETVEADSSLTLLTFNIRSANNVKGSVELEKIIEEIRETGAHIIGLQEVERLMPRSRYQEQARLIAEELGYYYYYGENINILGVQYGNALLSKYPILKASNHKLPKEKLEPRGMIEAVVDIDRSLWHVYVTHLGLNSVERNKQVNYISRVLSQKEGNIVLLGDFNNHADSKEMTILDARMIDSAVALNRSDQYTFAWQDDTPNVRIDRIYASDNIELKHHEVRPSTVSDHERVLTQIQLNTLPEEGIQQATANKDK